MRGLTQERLADLVDMSRNSISNIERNENNSGNATDPLLSTIYRLAEALDVPPAVLLPGADRRTEDICSADSLEIEFVWPASAQDRLSFSADYVERGKSGESQRYAVAAPREDAVDRIDKVGKRKSIDKRAPRRADEEVSGAGA